MKSINIFTIINRLDDTLLVDVTRQRQLYDESIHIIVMIQTFDGLKQCLFSDIFLKTDE